MLDIDEITEIIFSDFILAYDGVYTIATDGFQENVFLDLTIILKMIKIEGLTYDDIDKALKSSKYIRFKKVKLKTIPDWDSTLGYVSGNPHIILGDRADIELVKIELVE